MRQSGLALRFRLDSVFEGVSLPFAKGAASVTEYAVNSQRTEFHMSSDTVVAKTCKSEAEAHLASSLLESSGIKASVHRFSRYRAIAGGGYLVKVSPRDLGRAKSILKKTDRETDMDEYVSDDDDSYTRCPKCNSVNITVTPLAGAALWLTVLLIGIPLLFIKRGHKCRKCGHAWIS